ncbi:MAG: UDP-N-acetyl-D-mannosamine dehydrogenase [Pseudomonadota bacterium]
MHSVNVIGLGYIGLPTAALFADAGIMVHGTDKDQNIVECVAQGTPHFGEPELDVLLRRVKDNGLLKASTDIVPSDVYIIAVPTPLTEDKKPDLTYVHNVIDTLIPLLRPEDLIIIESTVPPRCCEMVAEKIASQRSDLRPAKIYDDNINLYIAHCPERVLPGRILHELVHNDRVIGGISRKCTQKAIDLYKIAVKGTCHATNATTAEMIKLTENAYRDVNIAFANELSMICDQHDMNVWDVIALANKHPRVNILSPGPGVGGHCIAVDPWFIVDEFPESSRLIQTARYVNDSKPQHVIDQTVAAAKKLVDPYILCLGLSYKADVEDLRESPSLDIVRILAKFFPDQLAAADPLLSQTQKEELSRDIKIVDFEGGLKKANIIVLLTDHTVFKTITHNDIMQKIVIDTRGMWS